MNTIELKLYVSDLVITPETSRHFCIEFKAIQDDILDNFTFQEMLNVKNPNISELLKDHSISTILDYYNTDDIVQYLRDRRIDEIL